MKPKVLIVNEIPALKDERCWLEAKTLANAGYTVSVIAPKINKADSKYDFKDGVHLYMYRGPAEVSGFIGYFWEFMYCWIRTSMLAFKVHRRVGFDVIHACNPPDTFFLLGAIYKLFKKQYVFAQHDVCPELWLSRFGEAKGFRRLLYTGLLWLEKMSYRVADLVIVPNESYKAIAKGRGCIDEQNVFVVRNGPDLNRIRTEEPNKKLKKGRSFLVCYLGIMNPQDGVDYFCRAIAHLVHNRKRKDVHFAFVGTGDSLAELKDLCRDLRIEDFLTFTGWIFDSQLLSEYLSTADVCVAPDPDSPHARVSSFMKIMDYMAVGKPIVAFDLPETRVSAQEAAIYAKRNDTIDFANKIDFLLENDEERKRMGEYGRQRVYQGLSWHHSAQVLINAYGFLLNQKVDNSILVLPQDNTTRN